MAELTQARLRELLNYNPETGEFQWSLNVKRSGVRAGSFTGARPNSKKAYSKICVDGRSYPAHRLAWLYMTGSWPSEFIDHINGVRSDNRFTNLREATGTQNQGNSKLHKHNTSGYRGVYRKGRRWVAYIYKKAKQVRVGSFETLEAARQAYANAAADYFLDFAPHR